MHVRLILASTLLWTTAAHANPSRVFVPAKVSSSAPDAATKAAASKEFARAQKAYAANKLDKALEAAKRVWRMVPNAQIASIVATILLEQNKGCDALEYLLVGMDLQPSPKVDAGLRKGLKRAGRLCKPAMGWARITAEPHGAMVSIAGQRLLTPQTIGLSVGQHEVQISAPGRVAKSKTLQVVAGEGQTLALSLGEIPEFSGELAPKDPDPPKALAPSARVDDTVNVVLIGTGIGVGLLGAAMAAGFQIAGLTDTAGLSNDEAQAKYNVPTVVSFGVGAAVGLTLILVGSLTYDDGEAADEPSTSGLLLPMVGPGSVGAEFNLTF